MDGPSPARYWLFKSEPEVYSIDHLAREPRQTTCWDGVRNYQARNYLRDAVQVGDRVLFYHSNADPPGIAGIAVVVRAGYPDPTAWDRRSPHFDPRSGPDAPTWYMVDIRLERKFFRPIGLDELRGLPEVAGMELLRRGSRLSVQPVRPAEFAAIVALAEAVPAATAVPARRPGKQAGRKAARPRRRG